MREGRGRDGERDGERRGWKREGGGEYLHRKQIRPSAWMAALDDIMQKLTVQTAPD
jgi:hypothetical protein